MADRIETDAEMQAAEAYLARQAIAREMQARRGRFQDTSRDPVSDPVADEDAAGRIADENIRNYRGRYGTGETPGRQPTVEGSPAIDTGIRFHGAPYNDLTPRQSSVEGSPVIDPERDPGETGGFPEPTRRAINTDDGREALPPVHNTGRGPQRTAPTPSARGGTGGAAGGGRSAGGRKALDDQTRTEAYDPTLDANDPRNRGVIDVNGRVQDYGPKQPTAAGAPRGRSSQGMDAMGGTGRTPGGSNQGMSSNNAANDMSPALAGAVDYAREVFHQGDQSHPLSKEGYKAMTTENVGAPTSEVMHAVFAVVDPKGELPMNRRMELATKAVYDWYNAQGEPEIAKKAAFETIQFGAKMSKAHGEEAVNLLAKGDLNGAVHQLQASYGWIPDGHTVEVAGNELHVVGPGGKISMNIPINPQSIAFFAQKAASGQLAMDVIAHRAGEAGGAAPSPSPGVPSPPTQPPAARPPAQPAAAPAGPQAPPPAAPAQPPAAAQPTAVQTTPPPPVTPPSNSAAEPEKTPAPSQQAAPKMIRRGSDEPDDGVVLSLPGMRNPVRVPLNEVDGILTDIYNKKWRAVNDDVKGLPKAEISKVLAGVKAQLTQEQQALRQQIKDARADYKARLAEENSKERESLRVRDVNVDEDNARTAEARRRFTFYTKPDATPDAKAVVAASPLRFLKTEEEQQPIIDIAKKIRAHNSDIPYHKAVDLALEATSHIGDDEKARKVTGNGKIGKDGTRYMPVGKDLLKQQVLAFPSGVKVHLPNEVVRQIEELREQSWNHQNDEETKAKAREKQNAEDLKRIGGSIDTMMRTKPNMRGLE